MTLEGIIKKSDVNDAGGDFNKTPIKKPNPVPSCRKFTPKIDKNNELNKRKIQEALNEISIEERAGVMKKKALTLSEIKPTRAITNKM